MPYNFLKSLQCIKVKRRRSFRWISKVPYNTCINTSKIIFKILQVYTGEYINIYQYVKNSNETYNCTYLHSNPFPGYMYTFYFVPVNVKSEFAWHQLFNIWQQVTLQVCTHCIFCCWSHCYWSKFIGICLHCWPIVLLNYTIAVPLSDDSCSRDEVIILLSDN